MARSLTFWLLSAVGFITMAALLVVAPQRLIHMEAPASLNAHRSRSHKLTVARGSSSNNRAALNHKSTTSSTAAIDGSLGDEGRRDDDNGVRAEAPTAQTTKRRRLPRIARTVKPDGHGDGEDSTAAPTRPNIAAPGGDPRRGHGDPNAMLEQDGMPLGELKAQLDATTPASEQAEVGSAVVTAPHDTKKPDAGIKGGSKPSLSTKKKQSGKAAGKSGAMAKVEHLHKLVPEEIESLILTSPVPDIVHDRKLLSSCAWTEKESTSNVNFANKFAELFQSAFPGQSGPSGGGGLHWWLDEGGLIGSGRAGSMNNADDDFDFFAFLPNQLAPCVADSVTCTPKAFDAFIHKFLMVMWNQGGMCINKFNPRLDRFNSRKRLMYSFQLNREKQFDDVTPDGAYPFESDVPCFKESTPFAHLHLGILQEGTGLLKTNVWAVGTTHPMDELDLRDILPVGRCRVGNAAEAPCPKNITKYLTVRNRGEYRKKSSDGNCLLVRNKWGLARKKSAVALVRKLDQCGYNSMVDLADAFEASGYKDC